MPYLVICIFGISQQCSGFPCIGGIGVRVFKFHGAHPGSCFPFTQWIDDHFGEYTGVFDPGAIEIRRTCDQCLQFPFFRKLHDPAGDVCPYLTLLARGTDRCRFIHPIEVFWIIHVDVIEENEFRSGSHACIRDAVDKRRPVLLPEFHIVWKTDGHIDNIGSLYSPLHLSRC